MVGKILVWVKSVEEVRKGYRMAYKKGYARVYRKGYGRAYRKVYGRVYRKGFPWD